MDHIQGEVDWHSYLADISAEELHSIIDICSSGNNLLMVAQAKAFSGSVPTMLSLLYAELFSMCGSRLRIKQFHVGYH